MPEPSVEVRALRGVANLAVYHDNNYDPWRRASDSRGANVIFEIFDQISAPTSGRSAPWGWHRAACFFQRFEPRAHHLWSR